MTAHCPISAREMAEGPQDFGKTGEAFRGRFLDKCAIVEHWAAALLEEADCKPRSTYLFGHKLKAVRELANAEPSPFKSPKRVLELLDSFQVFADLRTLFAHSIQTVAQTSDGTRLAIYTPVRGSASPHLSVVLNEDEMAYIARDLARLAKEFGDQRLKGSSPSSPPPPKRAAAAGP